jgi:hypothetical protein
MGVQHGEISRFSSNHLYGSHGNNYCRSFISVSSNHLLGSYVLNRFQETCFAFSSHLHGSYACLLEGDCSSLSSSHLRGSYGCLAIALSRLTPQANRPLWCILAESKRLRITTTWRPLVTI